MANFDQFSPREILEWRDKQPELVALVGRANRLAQDLFDAGKRDDPAALRSTARDLVAYAGTLQNCGRMIRGLLEDLSAQNPEWEWLTLYLEEIRAVAATGIPAGVAPIARLETPPGPPR